MHSTLDLGWRRLWTDWIGRIALSQAFRLNYQPWMVHLLNHFFYSACFVSFDSWALLILPNCQFHWRMKRSPFHCLDCMLHRPHAHQTLSLSHQFRVLKTSLMVSLFSLLLHHHHHCHHWRVIWRFQAFFRCQLIWGSSLCHRRR